MKLYRIFQFSRVSSNTRVKFSIRCTFWNVTFDTFTAIKDISRKNKNVHVHRNKTDRFCWLRSESKIFTDCAKHKFTTYTARAQRKKTNHNVYVTRHTLKNWIPTPMRDRYVCGRYFFRGHLPSINFFTLLDDVGPDGLGTFVITSLVYFATFFSPIYLCTY